MGGELCNPIHSKKWRITWLFLFGKKRGRAAGCRRCRNRATRMNRSSKWFTARATRTCPWNIGIGALLTRNTFLICTILKSRRKLVSFDFDDSVLHRNWTWNEYRNAHPRIQATTWSARLCIQQNTFHRSQLLADSQTCTIRKSTWCFFDDFFSTSHVFSKKFNRYTFFKKITH